MPSLLPLLLLLLLCRVLAGQRRRLKTSFVESTTRAAPMQAARGAAEDAMALHLLHLACLALTVALAALAAMPGSLRGLSSVVQRGWHASSPALSQQQRGAAAVAIAWWKRRKHRAQRAVQ
jgi:hypothetical protein